MIRLFSLLALALLTFGAEPALSAPHEWQLGFQDAASPSAERLHEFHNLLLYIITGITIFVMGLLFYVIVRYNKWANPVPQQFSHNIVIEVIWTVVPVLILIAIVVPSYQLLYYLDRTETPEMTLKVTGSQWYWSYEYPDQPGVAFSSYMVPSAEIDKTTQQVPLLSTDNPVVLPVDTNIQIIVTASDVLHAWAVPALGVKIDGMPGRLNETWVRIDKPGTYYGQCSELCGKDHAFMPIEIRAVPKDVFTGWVNQMKSGTPPAAQAPAAQPAAQE